MSQSSAASHETWSSKSAFLLGTAGAAVGLGNLWRFPFIAGENGGGAFVILYLGFVILLGVPIMMAEMAIGRQGGASPVQTMRNLVKKESLHANWKIIGWLSIFIPLIGLSFYSVVGGWAVGYVMNAANGAFAGFDANQSQTAFDELLASPVKLLLIHTVFLGTSTIIVARGLSKGIEWIAKFMMPALFILLLIMVANSIFFADIQAGLSFLFKPDFSKLTTQVVFMALGQAFFSVAIGVGVLMTYSAYLPKDISIPRSAFSIAIIDTGVALLAGLAIFPLVFTYGLNPSGGPGLIFVTLPVAFGQMPGGAVLGFLFFLLLFFAAFSTAIGMLEPVVSWLSEHKDRKRAPMALAAGFSAWVLGALAALSFNIWQDFKPMDFIPLLSDKTIFDLMDFFVSNLLLPLNGLLIALFASWALSRKTMLDQFGFKDGYLFKYWLFTVKYIAPVAIGFIFYTSLIAS